MKARPSTLQWLRSYYDAIDNLRFDEVAAFLHDDCRCQYPNGAVITGRERFIQWGRRDLGALRGTRHELREAWEEGDELIFELEVTYWREDGGRIARPGVGIFLLDDGRIRAQRLFVDARGVWD